MVPSSRNRRLLPLIVVSALSFLALDAAGFGPFGALRRAVLSVGQPIRVVLGAAVAPVGDVWDGAVHYDEVVAENGELRRQVADLEGRFIGQADLERDLQDLLEATEIDYLGDTERVSGRVIADRRTELERIVELDKGSDDGIARGMPVVTGRGLVGTVEVVTDDRATVRLITDGNVAVGVRSESGLGLAAGRRESTLELLASPELAESIRIGAAVDGERFVTSGVDRSVYPSGIPVGELDLQAEPESPIPDGGPGSIDPASPSLGPGGVSVDQPSLDALVLRPFADIDRLSYLTVLLIAPDA